MRWRRPLGLVLGPVMGHANLLAVITWPSAPPGAEIVGRNSPNRVEIFIIHNSNDVADPYLAG